MAGSTPEGKVKRKVDKVLTAFGCYYFMPVQTGYGKKTLDYIGCFRGRFFAVETKAPGEKTTPLQDLIIAEMRHVGGQVFVVDGDGSLAVLVAWLDALKEGVP